MNIWKSFKNPIQIKINGSGYKRFLNLCVKNQIILNNLIKKEGGICFEISENDWNIAKKWIPKTGIQYEIIGKQGVKTWSYKWKKRKLFLYFPIYVLMACYIFSFFLWKIEIIGNFSTSTNMIVEFLKKEKINIGCRADKIDTRQLELDFLNVFSTVQWVSINIEGTTLQIALKEKENILSNAKENTVLDEEHPVGLATGHDGKLISILTRKGIPLVKAGQDIAANQILIEGKIPIFDSATNECISYEIVEPEGEVILQYDMPYSFEIKNNYIQKEYTGHSKSFYKVRIGNKIIPIFEKSNPFAFYDILEEQKEYSFGQLLHIPLSVWKCKIKEYMPIERLYSDEEMKNIIETEFQKNTEVLKEKGVQIIEKNVTMKKTINTMGLYGEITVLDNNLIQIPLE